MTPGAEAFLTVILWAIGGLLSLIVVLIGSMCGMMLYRARKSEGKLEKLAEIFEARMIGLSTTLEKAVMESLDDRHALRVMLEGHAQLIVSHSRELEAAYNRLNQHGNVLDEHGKTLVKHDTRLSYMEKRP